MLARGLGADGRGTWALIASFDIASTLILAKGVSQATGYFYLKAATPAEEHRVVLNANRLLFETTAVSGILGAFLFVGAAVTPWTWLWIPAALTLTTPAAALQGAVRQVSVARSNDKVAATLDAGPAIAQMAAVVALFALGRISIASVLFAYSLTRLCGGILAASQWPTTMRAVELRSEMSSYGWRALPTTLGQLAQGRVDQLAVLTLGRPALGVFAVGALVGNLAYPAYQSSAALLFRAKSPTAAEAPAFRRWAQLWFLSAVGGAASIILVGPIYGEAFSEAGWVALTLAVGSGGYGLFLLGRAMLDRNGMPGRASLVQIGHLLVVALVLPFVAIRFGLLGVASASALLQFVRGFVTLLLARRVTRVD